MKGLTALTISLLLRSHSIGKRQWMTAQEGKRA
jgi:hypothetical protein